jgi:shikimate dehydrogenase
VNEVFDWREAPAGDFAVIGDPVQHSLSPKMHSAAYSFLGLSLRYFAIHVKPGDVAEALDHLSSIGYRGINVTVPHKEEALMWARKPHEFATRARAANTLCLEDGSAINTDAPGFLDTISGVVATGSEVLMIGAGGSARALAIAMVEAGYKVKIQNRTRQKADEIAKISGATTVDTLDPSGVELIVNTTSASLHGQVLPIPWDRAEPSALAYDLAYAPHKTAFMLAAEQSGIRAMDGRELLVAQGARSFEWWLGLPAPREAMREALR